MDFKEYKESLKKQGYRFVGEHSAVKICEWTKKSIKNKGVCYKEKFYGIHSHQCAQISVTVNFCDFNCIHCWRSRHNSKFKKIDIPKEILENIPEQQRLLLSGLGGYKYTNMKKLKESSSIMHYAISLTGETLYYPRLNELINEIKKQKKTSFIVTNGSQPEILKKLEPPTQLYISLNAPNKELFKKITNAKKKTAWDDINKSLDILKEMKDKTRTTLRITLIKGMNMIEPENYAKLIMKAEPLFVEVKAFMLLGESRKKLRLENQALHKEIKAFAKRINKHCNYKIIDEYKFSRVVLLMQEDFKGRIIKVI